MFFISGDFNLSNILWTYEDALSFNPLLNCTAFNREAASIISPILSSMDLIQIHPLHSKKEYTLDLVFSSAGSVTFLHSDDALVSLDSKHHESATFITNRELFLHPDNFHHSRYNFNRMGPEIMNYCLSWIGLNLLI